MHVCLQFFIPASGLVLALWTGHALQWADASDDTACSTAVGSASQLNAFALMEGARACSMEGRQGDTNFLFLLGQMRAGADVSSSSSSNFGDECGPIESGQPSTEP